MNSNVRPPNLAGRNLFHARCMSWSYRNRGNDPRAQINSTLSVIVVVIMLSHLLFQNTAAAKQLMKIIDIYSAKKRITNETALYSVLNPLTSSDSPSAKSKGDRFVSANLLTTTIRKGIIINIAGKMGLFLMRLNFMYTITLKRSRDRLTS